MKSNLIAVIVFVVCLSLAPIGRSDEPSQQSTLKQAEARIREIYQDGKFWGRRPNVRWEPNSALYAIPQGRNKLNLFDATTGKRVGQRDAKAEMLSPDGSLAIENRRGDLFVRDLESQTLTRLTERDGERDTNFRRPRWSPNGKRIVFVESDQTDVRLRSMLVPSDPSYPGVREQRFARVGEKIAKLRVGVVDRDGGNLRWLNIESPREGFYLEQVEWSNDEQVLIEKLSRFRDRRAFDLIDVDSDKSVRIFDETNEAWAVSSQGKNLGLMWLDGGERFLVISEKDGWRHAFLYSRDGQELRLLTPGKFDIIDRVHLDEASGFFYFYASPSNATQRYLYRVPLEGNDDMQRITPMDQPGWHDYKISPDGKFAIHTWSRLDTPPMTEVVEIPTHRPTHQIEVNQAIQERMQQLNRPPTEFVQLDTGGDFTMDAWLMKPKGFDETKEYPVFIYVYGEPHGQTVLDQWNEGQSHFHRVIADMGYIVVSIDNRGTPAPKGAAWRRSIFRSLGPLSTEDQAAALKELGNRFPFIDSSRVAIWGWSGGGSNTLNAMFRKPDQYHVGIAVVPKPQPHLYNAWFQEIYMRTRKVNAEGYQRSAPINFADGLQGKLLMITGSGETNTHIQIIEGLVDRLVELGKPFDYMVYPNRNHGLREGRGTEVHVRMLIARYLLQHLPAGPRS